VSAYTRFVTERDEAIHNDCTICSVLMAIGYATGDAIWRQTDGTPMTAAQVKAFREAFRMLSGDVAGGTNLHGAVGSPSIAATVGKRWPSLAPSPCQDVPWATILARWKAGWAGAVIGNPIRVTNASSPLRRWTTNDDYGHAIFAGPSHSDGIRGWIQDPMGFGDYEGQWVPLAELRQFMAWGRRADGTYHTFLFAKEALLSTTIIQTVYAGPRELIVPAGNRKIGYRLNAKTGRLEPAVDVVLNGTLRSVAVAEGVVRQYPVATVKPNDLMYLVGSEGSHRGFAGLWIGPAAVSLGKLPAPGPAIPVVVDTKALIAQGFAAAKTAAKTASGSAIDALQPPA
jgi:hypothetical protein